MPELPELPSISEDALSVVLIAWNEEAHLEQTLADWKSFANDRKGETRVHVIDDGSEDETFNLSSSTEGVTIHRHAHHQGLGACLRTAISQTESPLLAVSLCDPSYKSEMLKPFLSEIDKVHMVTGFRAGRSMPGVLRLLGGIKRGLSKILLTMDEEPLPGFLGRRGHVAGFLSRLIFGLRLHDVACPFFLVRRDILKHAPIQSNGAFGIIELLAKVNYLKGLFAEQQIPIKVEPTIGKWRDDSLRSTIREARKVFSHPEFQPTPTKEEYPDMIHVIATIELNEGRREDFLKEFRELMPKVHAENGCLEYGPTEDATTDIAAQIDRRENVVTIMEKWESLEALKAHLVAEHMISYRERVKDIVKSVSLQILKPI